MGKWPIKILILSSLIILAACRQNKVELLDSYGQILDVNSHWFENEKVAYIFFRIEELPERLTNPVFELSYTWTNPQGGSETVEDLEINFTEGVHEHEVIECGSNQLCYSFSWPLDGPLQTSSIRFRYDKEAELNLFADASSQNHLSDDPNGDGFSALPHGVFNQQNNRMQVRITPNFGTPAPERVPSYGLRRKFRIKSSSLVDQDWDDLKALIDGSGYAFPSDFCSQTGDGESKVFKGLKAWSNEEFAADSLERGVCFGIDFLDKNEKNLVSTQAYGIRNPNTDFDENLVIQTPLEDVVKIPILIHACEDDPFFDILIDQDFLEYQKFITGQGGREVDVCFNTSNIEGFAQNLEDYLSAQLSLAKQQATTDQDFMFNVIFHENLSREFRAIHQAVVDKLTLIASNEVDKVSPRLAGSFVYASIGDFQPTLVQRRTLLWCPQDLANAIAVTFQDPFASINCTTSTGGDFTILGINFRVPLGPFPDLDSYNRYLEKYGDRGLARDPELVLKSVQQGSLTYVDGPEKVTYFDNVRLSIADEEAVRLCSTKEDSEILEFIKVRNNSLGSEGEGVNIFDIAPVWRSEDAAGTYDLGIFWEYPFWGGVRYDAPVTVAIGSIIPYEEKNSAYEAVGDIKWQIDQWNLGDFFYYCRKYCEHPFFDEAGTYQNRSSWRDEIDTRCAQPLIPEYQEE